MSRRKQEKPQQRRTLEEEDGDNSMFDSLKATDVGAMDSGSDVLICGECQTEFSLDDIVRFIRHKVHKCNKENIPCKKDKVDDGQVEPEPDHGLSIVGGKRPAPSISAPIGLKNEVKVQNSPINLTMETDDISRRREESSKRPRLDTSAEELVLVKKHVDAESNTINSEPYSFLCVTCKSKFDSAWSLVQHAQNAHGLKIYVDANANINNNTICHNKNDPEPVKPSLVPRSPRSPIISSSFNGSLHHRSPQPSRDGLRCRDSSRDAHEIIRDRDPVSHSAAAIITSSLTNGLTPANQPSSRGSSTHSSPIKASDLTPHPPPHLLNMDIGQHPHPFMFRMPLGADRQPLSPMNHGPFVRPPDFRMDFLHDPFHRMIGIPPRLEPPPPPGMFPNALMERPRPVGQPEQPMDFYSQRLRRLAGTTAASQPEPVSPGNRRTPPFAAAITSTSAPTTTTVSSDMTGQLSPAQPKHKACEFCGKAFRFQSNLIVHRRSHTGEKPFKCSLCPHACTQASKLKRHMKTHINRSPFGGMGSFNIPDCFGSRSSTPDSTGMNNNEDDSDDEEEEEPEDEEEEEMDLDEAEPRDKEPYYRRRNEPSEDSSECVDEASDETDLTTVGDRQALLAEVMEKSGLGGIQAYSEAFQQALAENNNKNSDSKDMKPHENGLSFSKDGQKTPSEKEMKVRPPSGPEILNSPFRFHHHPNPLLRHHPDGRVKMEPSEQHMANMDALYSSIWFPPTANPRDVFMGPIRHPMDHSVQHHLLGRPHQNGGPPHSAFLESLHHHTPPGLGRPPGLIQPHGPRPLSASMNHNDKKNNRTDQCEFCGKVFKNCSNLTVHRRSHTGEKPYRCELCSYACAQSSKLTRHMRTHCRDGKDVYRCKFCQMPFSVPSTLEKHMRKCVENHNMKMDASSISSSPLSMDAPLGLDMSLAKPSPAQSV